MAPSPQACASGLSYWLSVRRRHPPALQLPPGQYPAGPLAFFYLARLLRVRLLLSQPLLDS